MKKSSFFFALILFLGVSIYAKAEQENAVIVCHNSLEMFEWDLEFIREAQHSIEMSACFAGGKILQALLTEIEARLEVCPDLKVFFLMTPVLLEEVNKDRINHLLRNYPANFHLTHASNVLNVGSGFITIDNHIKTLIVDEKYFSVGGTNFDDSLCSEGTFTPLRNQKGGKIGKYLPAGTRDQDVVGKGAVAKELRLAFYNLFALWEQFNNTRFLEKNPNAFEDRNCYKALDPFAQKAFVTSFETADSLIPLEESQLQLICGGPHQTSNKITRKYKELIDQAKKEIVIGNLYFSPEKSIFEALLASVNRDVQLQVITNGIHDEAPFFCHAFAWGSRMHYTPILYGRTFHLWEASKAKGLPIKSTRVYEYLVKDVIYHKKVMIVDRRYFIIGSYNLGLKSHNSDYELILVIDSPEVAEEAMKVMDRDVEYSQEVNQEEASKWYFDPVTAFIGETQLRYHNLI